MHASFPSLVHRLIVETCTPRSRATSLVEKYCITVCMGSFPVNVGEKYGLRSKEANRIIVMSFFIDWYKKFP